MHCHHAILFSSVSVAILVATAGCSHDRDHMSSRSSENPASPRWTAERNPNTYAGTLAPEHQPEMPVTRPMVNGQPVNPGSGSMHTSADVMTIIAGWAERPRLGAQQLIDKYGEPQEATPQKLTWLNQGAYNRIWVANMETPHDFPLPHVDFMEHTIAYNVPQDKVADLIAFDGSSTINKTVGELSARCDLEGHNILTLNLDHDIVMGKMTVEEARQAFGKNVDADVRGQHPPYLEALQFKPEPVEKTAFKDVTVIPGSYQRPEAARKMSGGRDDIMGDSEVLATIIAVDLNEVLAGAAAEKENIPGSVMAFAKEMHGVHGQHMVDTMKLGLQASITPVITPAVESLQKKGANELAMLVPLDGDAFARAYVNAMVKGHAEVLSTIDSKLMPMAQNDAVKQHLVQTRSVVADHLEHARKLQTTLGS